MPRKAKGVHTNPEDAGEKNIPDGYVESHQDNEPDGLMSDILEVYNIGKKNRQDYGGRWTDEQLEESIGKFFQFVAEHNMKPAKAGLRLWLGISKTQYWEWETKPEKYGFKSNLLSDANDYMEWQYVGRMEKYPTGNIFLLKTSHGHIETSKVDVTSTNTIGTADINELVSKMGLDKTK